MIPVILKILTITSLCMFNPVMAEEIWRENFPISEKGIWGSVDGSIQSDFSGITTWTLEYSQLDLSDSGDYAKTVSTSGGRFEACDIDGEVVWLSEWIDISEYEKVKVELTASETGSGANTETKYLKAYYRLDGGKDILFHENEMNTGNWGSAVATCNGLTGQSLQIACYISNHYASDKVILNAVSVQSDIGLLPPAVPFDIVINELMCDPYPPEGLPEVEYIELFNTRNFPVSTENWELRIDGVIKKLQNNMIEPGGYLILCATGSLESLLSYGNVSNVVGFQGLLNLGAVIEIVDNKGTLIDYIAYSDTWYADDAKKNGGWSLERIDPNRHCNQQENWKSSQHPEGGTPGRKNSIFAENPDVYPPSVRWAVAVSENEIELVFSEPIDTIGLKNINNFQVAEWENPAKTESISSEQITLHFARPFQKNITYTLQINNLSDECGNPLTLNQFEFQWNILEPGNVVINEVLFDPSPGGEDFVEIYNLSDKLVDLSRLYLGNRSNELKINEVYRLTEDRKILFPESYLALTKDTNAVFPWFFIHYPSCFLQMGKVPSYPNTEGYVVLLNDKSQVIDELYYSEKMHSPFLADAEGVSLERVSFAAQTNVSGNWHSASTGAGYGTPGYKNSQAGKELTDKPIITFGPEAFSPNNDGYNDDYIIRYELARPGYMGNIKVFDAAGRFIMHLANNEILGTAGEFLWNGEDETGQRQSLGVYIVLVEIFNAEGEIHRFKDGVVLTELLE